MPALVIPPQGSIAVIPAQAKMARAALGWTLDDVAKAAGVHRNTVSNFELGKYGGDPETLAKMRKAFEAAGLEFTNGDTPGVRLKKKRR